MRRVLRLGRHVCHRKIYSSLNIRTLRKLFLAHVYVSVSYLNKKNANYQSFPKLAKKDAYEQKYAYISHNV